MTDFEPSHRHCLTMFDKLSQYIDNELDPASQQEIAQHVKKCLACSVCLETLKRTIAFCRHPQNKPIPETLSRNLRTLVQNYKR
jgi:anti-sigma factor RsiW